jgi:hypothetical protein
MDFDSLVENVATFGLDDYKIDESIRTSPLNSSKFINAEPWDPSVPVSIINDIPSPELCSIVHKLLTGTSIHNPVVAPSFVAEIPKHLLPSGVRRPDGKGQIRGKNGSITKLLKSIPGVGCLQLPPPASSDWRFYLITAENDITISKPVVIKTSSEIKSKSRASLLRELSGGGGGGGAILEKSTASISEISRPSDFFCANVRLFLMDTVKAITPKTSVKASIFPKEIVSMLPKGEPRSDGRGQVRSVKLTDWLKMVDGVICIEKNKENKTNEDKFYFSTKYYGYNS